MNIELEKSHLIERIKEIHDTDLLHSIKALLDIETKGATDFWDTLTETEKNAIQKGLDDLENGRVVSYEEVKKQIHERFEF